MKLLFIGSTKFGLLCLEKCLLMPEIDIVGIVTNSQIFSISYNPNGVTNFLYQDFNPIAQKYKIPIFRMTNKMNDIGLIDKIKEWKPDFILVVGWYHIIPKEILNMAPTAGLHASFLPDYSGGSPLVWAIINGEKETGISLFLMDQKVDHGPIIGQLKEPIYFEDTIASLYARIEKKGLQLLECYLPKIAQGNVNYRVQDEKKRRIMPQRCPEDGEINWNWSAAKIYNFIRAQTKPYPGAFTYLKEEKITIWQSSLTSDLINSDLINIEAKAGEILLNINKNSETLAVCCGDGKILLINQIGLDNNIILNGLDFIQRYSIKIGTFFGKSNNKKMLMRPSRKNGG